MLSIWLKGRACTSNVFRSNCPVRFLAFHTANFHILHQTDSTGMVRLNASMNTYISSLTKMVFLMLLVQTRHRSGHLSVQISVSLQWYQPVLQQGNISVTYSGEVKLFQFKHRTCTGYGTLCPDEPLQSRFLYLPVHSHVML